MNKRIKELAEQAGINCVVPAVGTLEYPKQGAVDHLKKFAELIVATVLDEVAKRAYYSGDRAWSDELDRPWVELEFGIGKLAELKKDEKNGC